jgi:uncharacterized protein YyaL (SSP411 family)
MSSPVSRPVAWLEWGPEAFARARTEGKPLLLSISASWCHGCAVMDSVSYADARVADRIAADLIPVRVDADRRPDVNDRYNLDGWPTTVLLTPSGEMLTGTTYLPPDGLLAMLDEVTRAYAAGREALDARAASMAAARRARRPAPPIAVDPDLAAPEWLADLIVRETDAEHGGFGADGKFLHVAALTSGVRQHARQPSAALAAALVRTLDALAGSGIRDAVGGGFFRYAGSREWMRPHTEKMLEDQVGLVRLFLEAARVFDRQDYLEVARDTIAFVHATLADPAEARFFGSQAADESYYQLPSATLRRTFTPPHVDRTLFTDWTAQAASAWIVAGDWLGDRSLAELGGRALDRAVVATYRPGEGLAHWIDRGAAGVRGLLTDQVHAARALLDLHEASGNPTWSMLAEELMRTAIRTLWDERAGGFVDRPPAGPDAVGMLADPLTPLGPNCVAATVLARLSRLTGDAGLQQRALDTLRAHTAGYRAQGLFGAPYALAVMDVFVG